MIYTLWVYHADGRIRAHTGTWTQITRWWDALQSRAAAGQLIISETDSSRIVVCN